MAAHNDPPLDEIMWSDHNFIIQAGAIHTNTVLPYFAQSPYFDATSNNATLMTQAMYNQNMLYIIQTRKAFEERLSSMQGLEFMVTHDPSENDTKREHNGIWVIRKQTRRKRPGNTDEITPISSYYVVGENIYMAPTLGNIIGSRMLSTVTKLTKLVSTASDLPNFTPATGHTYLPPISKTNTPGSSFQNTQSSEAATPLPGGHTPRPDTQDTASSNPSLLASKTGAGTDFQGLRLLAESWDLALRYGNEYMDENPIVGEPGSFKMSKARETAPTSSMSSINSSFQPFKGSAKEKKVPTASINTDLPMEPTKKGSISGAAKSPITPGTAKEKKGRRKSKAAGAGGTTSPRVGTPKPATPR